MVNDEKQFDNAEDIVGFFEPFVFRYDIGELFINSYIVRTAIESDIDSNIRKTIEHLLSDIVKGAVYDNLISGNLYNISDDSLIRIRWERDAHTDKVLFIDEIKMKDGKPENINSTRFSGWQVNIPHILFYKIARGLIDKTNYINEIYKLEDIYYHIEKR